MDHFIARFAAVADRDLMFCLGSGGIAYQADMERPCDYGQAYFDMYAAYDGKPATGAINRARVDLVDRHAGSECGVLDIGIGSGHFIRARPKTYGTDVNPVALRWLDDNGFLRSDLSEFRAFTMWDVLEHVPTPADYFDQMAVGSFLFLSMPIFDDLAKVRLSKHYKPNEHLYYFTEAGLIGWLALYGFKCLEVNDNETKAGRESVKSFAFQLLRV